MSRMTANLKRIGAITLAAALVLGQSAVDVEASASRGKTTDGDLESIVITEFAPLSASVKSQALTVGAKESDISFPNTLTATILVSDSGKEEAPSTDKDKEKEEDKDKEGVNPEGTPAEDGTPTDGTDPEQTTPEGETPAENPESQPTEGSNPEGSEQQTDATSEGEGTTGGDASEQTPAQEAGGGENTQNQGQSEQSEPAAGGDGSASIKDALNSFMIPSVVYASEEAGSESGDKTGTVTKEVTIENITWTIDPAASSKASFSSETAGDYFVYVAQLPGGYTTQAQLPSIKVTIEKGEITPSRKEFGSVQYLDANGVKCTIDDYAAVSDSTESVTWDNDWYVVGSDAAITGQINVKGIVNLVLTDGHKLDVSSGNISVETSGTLNIFGQDGYTGKLLVNYSSTDAAAINAIGGNLTISGGTVKATSTDGVAIAADNVTVYDGVVTATGTVGIYTKDKLTIVSGQTQFTSIGSQNYENGDVIFGYKDDNDFIKISGVVVLKEGKSVTIPEGKALYDGTNTYKGTFTATSVPSYTVFNNKTLTLSLNEETPNATFTATSTASGKIKGLVANAQYAISGAGLAETLITADATGAYSISKGIQKGTLLIVKKGDGSTYDSNAQEIVITKADNPSKLSTKACTTAENNDGKITGLDSSKKYEYRYSTDSKYTSVSAGATTITGLKSGTYLVRIRPAGAMLASASLKLEVGKYVAPKKVEAPVFSPKGGTYTTAQTVTITSSTADATIYYTTDGTVPSTGSRKYTGPITVDTKTTIKAFAVKEGMTNSTLASATYYINITEKKTTTGTSSSTGTVKRSTTTATTKTTGTTTKSSTTAKTNSTTKSSTTGSSTTKSSGTKSSSSSKSSSSKSSASRSSGLLDEGQPFIEGNPDQEGWEAINDRLGQHGAEKRVNIDMNGTSKVPSGTIDGIRGKDVTLVFDIGGGMTWSVNGLDVKGKAKANVDLGVVMDTDSIPEEVISEVIADRPDRPTRQLSLDYEGEFGFTAVLSVEIDPDSAGLYANLFYFNPATGMLEFVSCGKIGADGLADLIFSHASDYTVIVNEQPMGENTITTHVPANPESVTAIPEVETSDEYTDLTAVEEEDDMLLADAAAAPEAWGEGDYDEITDIYDTEFMGSSFGLPLWITLIATALVFGAIIFLCLQNKKKLSINA